MYQLVSGTFDTKYGTKQVDSLIFKKLGTTGWAIVIFWGHHGSGTSHTYHDCYNYKILAIFCIAISWTKAILRNQ